MKIWLVFLFLLAPPFATAKELLLSLGETRRWPLKGASSIWIQNKEILKAEATGSAVLLKGLREGQTVLKMGQETLQIQVLHPNKLESFLQLNMSVSKLIGLKVAFFGGDLILQGHLYRLQDWLDVATFAKEKAFSYQMQAFIAPSLQSEIQSYFDGMFAQAKIPPQTLVFQPRVEVRVSAPAFILQKYQSLLGPYGINVISDKTSLEIAPTVKVEITVAEVKRSLSSKWGLSWPSSYSAKILSTGEKEFSDVTMTLSALENNGDAKILASPNLLCRSGKEAEFLAGGEFPIKIINYKTQDVIWKRYGILLRVKPLADSTGRISLSVETEVSTLDDSIKADNIPGILTNRVSSHFDLTQPQTIALSGLLKNEDAKSSEGLPMLSRLPILGALFASKDFREHRTELIIFVRPSVITASEGQGLPLNHLQGL